MQESTQLIEAEPKARDPLLMKEARPLSEISRKWLADISADDF